MIFNLFKSKPNLKELIPDGFIDIHSHVLPGIDDGAKNLEQSLILIKEMKTWFFRNYRNLILIQDSTIIKHRIFTIASKIKDQKIKGYKNQICLRIFSW